MNSRAWFSLIAAAFLSSCDGVQLGGGYEIMDSGGSKRSLARNGHIIIPNIVTGYGRTGKYIVIESREYSSDLCAYHIVDISNEQVRPLRPRQDPYGEVLTGLNTHSIEALSYRSCAYSF